MCIWGYVGNTIYAFQIAGPLCVGAGILIYTTGFFVCCIDCLNYERVLGQKTLERKATNALNYLAKEEVIKWLQSKHTILEKFRKLSSSILDERR